MVTYILIAIIAVIALSADQNLLLVSGPGFSEPVIACVLALIISPWLRRQFD